MYNWDTDRGALRIKTTLVYRANNNLRAVTIKKVGPAGPTLMLIEGPI